MGSKHLPEVCVCVKKGNLKLVVHKGNVTVLGLLNRSSHVRKNLAASFCISLQTDRTEDVFALQKGYHFLVLHNRSNHSVSCPMK